MVHHSPLSRALIWSFVTLALACILVPTLYPAPGDEPVPLVYCIVCGETGAADVLTNIILFLPLGLALGLTGSRAGWLVLAGALLSGSIETAQLIIPGRDPSIGDLLCNTLGTGLGVIVTRTSGQWLLPSRAGARALFLGAAATLAAILLGTAWALQPALPDSRYFGQWTPNLGHLTWYRARVLRATLGTQALPPHRLADSTAVRVALLRGDTLTIQGIAGPRTRGLGSLFSIYDDRQREILLVGPDRDDLVLRYRLRAAGLRLDAPDLRLTGAMRRIERGDSLFVRASFTRRGWCLDLNGAGACPLGYTLGRAWALLMYPESFPPALRRLLDAAWMAGLALPLGFWGRRDWVMAGAAIAVVAGSVIIPAAAGVGPLTVLEWFGMAAGLGAGIAAATWLRRGASSAPRLP